MPILITTKDRMRSGANVRPCTVCLKTRQIVLPTETRCEYKRPIRLLRRDRRAGKNHVEMVRCINGLCDLHDTDLTVAGEHWEHICPNCMKHAMAKMDLWQTNPLLTPL